MNRVEFIGQTFQGEYVSTDDIVNYFDNTMAAYEALKPTDDISVHGNTDDLHSVLSLKVESTDVSKLGDLVTYINDIIHNRVNVYNRSFQIDASINESAIDLFVRESR